MSGRRLDGLDQLPADILQKIARLVAVNDDFIRHDRERDQLVWDHTAFFNVRAFAETCTAFREAVLLAPSGLRYLSISTTASGLGRGKWNEIPLEVALKFPLIVSCRMCAGKGLNQLARTRSISEIHVRPSKYAGKNLPASIRHLRVSADRPRDPVLPFLQNVPVDIAQRLESLSVSAGPQELKLISERCPQLQKLQIDLSLCSRRSRSRKDCWIDAVASLASLDHLSSVELQDLNCLSDDNLSDIIEALNIAEIALDSFLMRVGTFNQRILCSLVAYVGCGLVRSADIIMLSNVAMNLLRQVHSLIDVPVVRKVQLPRAMDLLNDPYCALGKSLMQLESLHLPIPLERKCSKRLLSWVMSPNVQIQEVSLVVGDNFEEEWEFLQESRPPDTMFRLIKEKDYVCL